MTKIIHAQIRVSGQVQGVGFRPFVYRLAHELGLAGWVRNDSDGVEIDVEGERTQVLRLVERLQSEPPALARVEKVTHDLSQAPTGMRGFTITASKTGKVQTGIAPDKAICPECLAELFDPANRRYRHPFINCIHCGPRYTLIARLPYDRANTSMAKFAQCPACQAEYDDPGSRRFHAQPNACPACGPSLQLYDGQWQTQAAADPIAAACERIRAGQIVAVKGIGGFHLVCDARNAEAVARLRAGKQREEKPFGVMVLNTLSARHYARFRDQDAALLETGERPIVLLRQSEICAAELQGVAPGLSTIGLMLPYAPLHYLLFHELLGKPEGADWLQQATPLALVMTSANQGGEPLVKDDAGSTPGAFRPGRCLPDPQSRHPAPLRRQRDEMAGHCACIHQACARLHAAPHRAAVLRAVSAGLRGMAEEHRVPHPGKRGLRVATHRRSRPCRCTADAGRDRRLSVRHPRCATAGRGARSAPRFLQHPVCAGLCRATQAAGVLPCSITTRISPRSAPNIA